MPESDKNGLPSDNYMTIPKMFKPLLPLKELKHEREFYFPSDEPARWMLGMLIAANDIGATLKLVLPFLTTPRPSETNEQYYRASHQIYFWRLLMAHLYEGWVHYNKGIGSIQHRVIDEIKKVEGVAHAHAEISTGLGMRFGDTSIGDFANRCRAVTFHYYDDEGDGWTYELRKRNAGAPMALFPDSNRGADVRWIVADEYLISRLQQVGMMEEGMQAEAAKVAGRLSDFIRNKVQPAYFDARESGPVRKILGDRSASS